MTWSIKWHRTQKNSEWVLGWCNFSTLWQNITLETSSSYKCDTTSLFFLFSLFLSFYFLFLSLLFYFLFLFLFYFFSFFFSISLFSFFLFRFVIFFFSLSFSFSFLIFWDQSNTEIIWIIATVWTLELCQKKMFQIYKASTTYINFYYLQ